MDTFFHIHAEDAWNHVAQCYIYGDCAHPSFHFGITFWEYTRSIHMTRFPINPKWLFSLWSQGLIGRLSGVYFYKQIKWGLLLHFSLNYNHQTLVQDKPSFTFGVGACNGFCVSNWADALILILMSCGLLGLYLALFQTHTPDFTSYLLSSCFELYPCFPDISWMSKRLGPHPAVIPTCIKYPITYFFYYFFLLPYYYSLCSPYPHLPTFLMTLSLPVDKTFFFFTCSLDKIRGL